MRVIVKRREPRSLTAHRKTAHSDYSNYKGKDELRRALVAEQRGLCCYCMARIRNNRQTTIEHWRSRHCYPGQELVYRNLLAVCPGGAGRRHRQQHCGERKGDRNLSWNPSDPGHNIETRVQYGSDGRIMSDDDSFDAELNDVLNLNLPVLKNHRKGMLTSVAEWWTYERTKRRNADARLLQRQREYWLPKTGELRPFCQVAVWSLDQRLSKLGR